MKFQLIVNLIMVSKSVTLFKMNGSKLLPLFTEHMVDILHIILMNLQIYDFMSCFLVNKMFNKVSSQDILFEKLLNDDYPNIKLFDNNYHDTYKLCHGLNKLREIYDKTDKHIIDMYESKEITNLKKCVKELENLHNLKKICINKLNITIIPFRLNRFYKLTHLNISNNSIKIFPSEIRNLMGLTLLDISHNSIISIPPEIGNLMELYSLDMSNNSITSIPPEIGDLISLNYLDVSNNLITTIPLKLCQLKDLHTFYLSINKITSIPSEIGNLMDLSELDISYNLITAIPIEFGNLKNLSNINISHNKLIIFPSTLFMLNGLDYNFEMCEYCDNTGIIESYCHRKEKDYYDDCSCDYSHYYYNSDENIYMWKYIDMSHNQLTSLPPEFCGLKYLRELKVSHNKLTWVPSKLKKTMV